MVTKGCDSASQSCCSPSPAPSALQHVTGIKYPVPEQQDRSNLLNTTAASWPVLVASVTRMHSECKGH